MLVNGDHWRIAELETLYGGCLTALGRFDEAETLLISSHERIEASVLFATTFWTFLYEVPARSQMNPRIETVLFVTTFWSFLCEVTAR